MLSLRGKATVVTGAASGIGLATARRFAAQGARVGVADIRGDAAARACAEIDGDVVPLELDVTSCADAERAIASFAERSGRLDVVVNNAGVTIVGPVHTLTEEEWDRQLAVNLKSVYLVSRAAWPFLAAQGGAIVNTASIAGLVALPSDAAYCASKAGVIALTKCMAIDGAPDRIRANCVCPGFTETPMLTGFLEDQGDPAAARRSAEGMHPLGLGAPDDLAGAITYLASEEAGWVTGTVLVVDGGLTSGLAGA
jgi:NAD(P)-dependent dehydrogenase (short-subunit alcohol dehydrogenase family)